MKITKDNFIQLLPSLHLASTELTGSKRRLFLAQLALNLGSGGKMLVSSSLGISRDTLRKGIREIESGIVQVDNFSARGRKPLEDTHPELLVAIKEIVDGASQTDPQFKSTRLYTRLSAKEVRNQLIKRGYQDAELPTEQTIWNKLHALKYKRKKVAKTKPKKKIKETDAIFEQLTVENEAADTDPGILRISYDSKDRVKIGEFSRGGKNWASLKANDHDFGGEYITPFGLYLPEFKETHLYLAESKVTSDCVIDILHNFWEINQARFSGIHTILLNADNGPENQSRRTQFIKRICEFAHKTNLTVKLAYYPPYHSKYNPVERVWGGLEQHWNGDIMDTQETVIKFAQSFVWNEKLAIVKVWNNVYEIGKKLSKKAMELHEVVLERFNDEIGKWFVTIRPEVVREVLNYD